jgi:rhodanese-related sulfurtransferase
MNEKISPGRDSISVHELAAWRRQDITHALLDVREAPELAICTLDNAKHIPMGEVPARLAELPRDVPLAVMCHHGMRSLRVVQFLREAGFSNAINLEGGIDAWSSQIDPGLQRY